MPPEDADGGSSPITLQYIEALRYGAELESTFGDPVRAQRYREAESRAVNAIRKLCWNKTYGLIADTPAQKHFSQHPNILGVWLDVVPPRTTEGCSYQYPLRERPRFYGNRPRSRDDCRRPTTSDSIWPVRSSTQAWEINI